MINRLLSISHLVGNTPLVTLDHEAINLFAKLEYNNLMGSVKMRAAYYILKQAIERGDITENTTVIESTSGNFGVALATLCKRLGITFIPVVDPNISPIYENLLHAFSYQVVKVTERDETGGFLLTRIQKIKELCQSTKNSFWTNQYGNIDCFWAHYHGLGEEIATHFDELDYAFIGVSSGGTISGVSRRLKEKFPQIKIIAVDSEGSVIFGDQPKKRYIPGIGSSMVPDLLKEAVIDEVIHVPEEKTIEGCYQLFENHAIFGGGSSGTSYYAITHYFKDKLFEKSPNVVFLVPDNGMAYVNTVYDKQWADQLHQSTNELVTTRK
ncbi:Cysteine synthase [Brevibacillus laterosporus]|nr:2,3-diaminopropionate biosynthesis protein SbnA [Brevibacillus laterosporus]RAP26375.1 Cysteine synthase [Brevibacillus laterosporus]